METKETMENVETTEATETMETLETAYLSETTETTDSTETTETTEIKKRKEKMADVMSDGPSYLARFDLYTMDFFQWLNAFEYIVEFLQIKYKRIVDFFFYMMETSAIEKLQQEFCMLMLFRLKYEELIFRISNVLGYSDETLVAESRFWDRDQFIGESPQQYMLALINLISNCNSRINTIDNLKGRFLQGLIKQKIVDICESKGNLEIKEVVDVAQTVEFYDSWSIIHKFV
ncbi:hypothetical protein M0804_014205 [Polistes exclamans]|nr:hypothetical protein M0804_014205 [Polistes exclamans]